MTLLATILIEYGVLRLMGENRIRVLLSSVIVNCLTNPSLNLFVFYVDDSWTTILIGELLVIVVETLWYYWIVRQWSQAAWYGCLCNAISFLTGLLYSFTLY